MSDAMAGFYAEHPHFANIAAGWEVREDPTITPTMATDGHRLYYSPDFVAQGKGLEPEGRLLYSEIVWLLLHEASHVWLGHHIRLTDVPRAECNVPFDLAIHEIIPTAPTDRLRRMVCKVGRGDFASLPPSMEAEAYYRLLKKPEPPQEPEPEPKPEDGEQEPESDDMGEQSEGEPSEAGEDSQSDAEGEGNGEEPKGGGAGDSQSNETETDTQGEGGGQSESDTTGGEPDTEKATQGDGTKSGAGQEESEYGAGGIGEVLPAQNCDTPAEKAKAEQEWQSVVAESMALAQTCGACPSWFQSISEKLLGSSETDWRTLLRRFLTRVVPQGMSYAKPNRRSCWRKDVIMPSRRSRGGGDGAIIADTSGSLFSAINDAVLPEIAKILESLPKTSVTLIQCDTRVVSEETFTQWDKPLKLTIQGGGGTDLCPAFERVAEQRHKLKWVICLTDFYWGFQNCPSPAGIPTLWVAVGRPDFKDKVPFGEVIRSKS